MIKFEYRPWTPDIEFDSMVGPPTVEQVTMTLGDDVSWDEAVCEFKNFLRAAGYVIPYDFEDDYVDCSDPPDMDKSGSLGDRQPEWANRMCDEEPLIDGYPLYSGLPNRKWVWLTREEEAVIIEEWHMQNGKLALLCQMIQDKMKEKNT